jgi:hypothetical protein
MKTTLYIDDSLFRQVKERAARTARTVTSMVDEALRQLLREESKPPSHYRFDARPVKGKPRSGVDLNDRDSLYETMDGRA